MPGTPTVGTGTTVMWDAPINPDGSSVTGLSGYNVYYATSTPLTATNSSIVAVNSGTTAVSLSLAPGTYYVAVTAVYSGGTESYPTGEVQAIVN